MHQKTSGSIGSFIIVGIVLALVALVAVYALRQQNVQQSAVTTETVAQQKADTSKTAAPEAPQPDAKASEQKDQRRQQSETPPKSPEATAPAGSTNDKDKATKQADRGETAPNQATKTPSQRRSVAPVQPTEALPQSGPVDAALMTVVVAGALVALSVSYRRSRLMV